MPESKDPSTAPNPSYAPIPLSKSGYNSFDDFYPYYLGEHSHPTNRRLHLLSTSISTLTLTRVLFSLLPAILTPLALHSNSRSPLRTLELRSQSLSLSKPWAWLLGGVVQGYFFAWLGHFVFERNKPATFKYPGYSLRGDLRMLREVVLGRRRA